MIVDVRTHLDLFDLDDLLLLARLGRLLLRLVLVLAEIQDLADRRLGVGRDLDQIEAGLGGALACVVDGDHADIVAGGVDELDVWSVDALVDAGASPVRG